MHAYTRTAVLRLWWLWGLHQSHQECVRKLIGVLLGGMRQALDEQAMLVVAAATLGQMDLQLRSVGWQPGRLPGQPLMSTSPEFNA